MKTSIKLKLVKLSAIIKGVYLLLIFCLFLLFFSCKKDNEVEKHNQQNSTALDTNHYGSLVINFTNVVGSKMLTINDSSYINANGDKFSINAYEYYISNIRLVGSDGVEAIEVDSYHLINANDSTSLLFTINHVVVKNYSSVTFTIGVDSLHNVSGAQSGALDPMHGMFWTWSTGYIMAKIEGVSAQSPAIGKAIDFHLGGFSGANNVLKTINLNFPSVAVVSATGVPQVKIKSDLLEWFQTPTQISFATLPSVLTSSANAKMISDNYQDMFTVTQVVN